MIYVTYKEEGKMRIDGWQEGEPASMPWKLYFEGLGVHGDQRERMTSERVMRSTIWRMFHWEPEAAEMVLGWIATGRWGENAATVNARQGKRLTLPGDEGFGLRAV